jgi:HD superfamily phosphohydrolase
MSNILKNLKGLFIKEEENAGNTSSTASKTNSEEKVVSTSENRVDTPKPIIQVSSSSGNGKVEDQYLDVLLASLEHNNQPGFDYFEFKNSLNSLSKMPMDDATRFKSAFAMAQTMGATPKGLSETASFYVNVLKNEEKKFQEALLSQEQKQIGDKRKLISSLEEEILRKNQAIESLKNEIQNHQNEVNKINQDLSNSSGKIESTKINFEASYNFLVNQIQEDIQKMNQFLK